MKTEIAITEQELVEAYLNGCVCPASGEWVDGERVVTALYVQPDCKIHAGSTGEQIQSRFAEGDYIRPEEVPPPMLPDPGHHVFFDEEAQKRMADAADRAWTEYHNRGHKKPRPIMPAWGPTPRELTLICGVCVLLMAAIVGFVFWRI